MIFGVAVYQPQSIWRSNRDAGGDGLLTDAFGLIARCVKSAGIPAEVVVDAIAELADACGYRGHGWRSGSRFNGRGSAADAARTRTSA